MNYRSKYVVIDTGMIIVPIVFSNLLGHADVAAGIRGKVLGAGFCFINKEGHYECYGESVSLCVKSRPQEDGFILNRYMGVIGDD